MEIQPRHSFFLENNHFALKSDLQLPNRKRLHIELSGRVDQVSGDCTIEGKVCLTERKKSKEFVIQPLTIKNGEGAIFGSFPRFLANPLTINIEAGVSPKELGEYGNQSLIQFMSAKNGITFKSDYLKLHVDT